MRAVMKPWLAVCALLHRLLEPCLDMCIRKKIAGARELCVFSAPTSSSQARRTCTAMPRCLPCAATRSACLVAAAAPGAVCGPPSCAMPGPHQHRACTWPASSSRYPPRTCEASAIAHSPTCLLRHCSLCFAHLQPVPCAPAEPACEFEKLMRTACDTSVRNHDTLARLETDRNSTCAGTFASSQLSTTAYVRPACLACVPRVHLRDLAWWRRSDVGARQCRCRHALRRLAHAWRVRRSVWQQWHVWRYLVCPAALERASSLKDRRAPSGRGGWERIMMRTCGRMTAAPAQARTFLPEHPDSSPYVSGQWRTVCAGHVCCCVCCFCDEHQMRQPTDSSEHFRCLLTGPVSHAHVHAKRYIPQRVTMIRAHLQLPPRPRQRSVLPPGAAAPPVCPPPQSTSQS